MALDPKVKEHYAKVEEKTDSFLTRLVASKGTAILVVFAIIVIAAATYILFK